ncbi:hypothetical protein DFJ63DRAFT_312932 [Scheffersomyces coipomensis]|uniref:uncharacterized protein n=1 Tax=Scheffersomyces coipomensis TaxID=1788519 RepID=UPI00315D5AAC
MGQSLLEIENNQIRYNHLTTGISSLDETFINSHLGIRNKIYDFQAAAGCSFQYTICVSLLISHISKSNHHRIIIIDTLSKFPWHLITNHPQYDPQWIDKGQIIGYTCDTFSKLLAIFALGKLDSDIKKDSTIIIINDFHETIDIYKYELSAIYEEYVLKNHLEAYETVLTNQDQFESVGTKTSIIDIPSQSDLLTTSAISKFESHLFSLLNIISILCFRSGSICLLLGHLDSKYENYSSNNHSTSFSSTSSQSFTRSQSVPLPNVSFNSNSGGSSSGRLVLAPFMSNTTTHKRNAKSFDSFITARLVFYKDWYHKTDDFHLNHPNISEVDHITLKQLDVRFVNAVKVTHIHSGDKSSPIIHFDYDNIYYHLDDDNSDEYEESYGVSFKLIDLSKKTGDEYKDKNRLELEKFKLRSTSTSTSTPTPSSRLPSSQISRIPSIRTSSMIPSSPNISNIQNSTISTSPIDNQIQILGNNTTSIPDDDSFVEESDNEVLGSVLLPINGI